MILNRNIEKKITKVDFDGKGCLDYHEFLDCMMKSIEKTEALRKRKAAKKEAERRKSTAMIHE